MKNAGLRYIHACGWIPFSKIESFLEMDKERNEYGNSGRDYVPKEYLRLS